MQAEITAVILAGGLGRRMGGVDKGLQLFNGTPLAQHALQRLQLQAGSVFINANRNIAEYESFGVPVWSDDNTLGEFAGPLAGVVTALQHCETPFLLTVPCDAPLFPADLATRLAAGLIEHQADIAVASAPESNEMNDGIEPGTVYRPQPVFSLMKASLLPSLLTYTLSGGRKVSAWMEQHRVVHVLFNLPGDARHAFFNANTYAELKQSHLLYRAVAQ
jgi:molybdenum cofactor guanylyltransferase